MAQLSLHNIRDLIARFAASTDPVSVERRLTARNALPKNANIPAATQREREKGQDVFGMCF